MTDETILDNRDRLFTMPEALELAANGLEEVLRLNPGLTAAEAITTLRDSAGIGRRINAVMAGDMCGCVDGNSMACRIHPLVDPACPCHNGADDQCDEHGGDR